MMVGKSGAVLRLGTESMSVLRGWDSFEGAGDMAAGAMVKESLVGEREESVGENRRRMSLAVVEETATSWRAALKLKKG
jgi:hypothetical protein